MLPTGSTCLREAQGAVHPALPLTSPTREGPAFLLETSTGRRESRQVKLLETPFREEIARNGTDEPPPHPQPAHSWKHHFVVVLLIYSLLPFMGFRFQESRQPCILQPPPQGHAPSPLPPPVSSNACQAEAFPGVGARVPRCKTGFEVSMLNP